MAQDFLEYLVVADKELMMEIYLYIGLGEGFFLLIYVFCFASELLAQHPPPLITPYNCSLNQNPQGWASWIQFLLSHLICD